MPRKNRKLAEPLRIRLKKNDTVKVISGRDKGKTGRVLEVDGRTGRVLVEGVMMVKRHLKANPAKQVKGGIAEKEGTIHVSNVMIVTSSGIATRIGASVETAGGKARRTRIARKTGESLDKK
ncbi:MAG: 50S ribosomal protein L24 [Bryobacteraceae bacterium]